jgi:predicted nuclease with TOPRIM domain
MNERTKVKSLAQIVNESNWGDSELREMMRLDVDHLDRLHERYQAAGDDSELADHLMHESWKAERDWVNENAELAFAITWQQHQISRQVNSDCHFTPMDLSKHSTGEYIRQATITEAEDSLEAEKSDDGSGVIMVEIDGKPTACYVS